MLPLSTQRSSLIALLCGLLLFAAYLQWVSPWKDAGEADAPILPKLRAHSGHGASNDTLGFGAIYLLTEDPTTWRVQGLLRAADLIGLQVNVPVQRHLPDDEVASLVDDQPPKGYGTSRALLNHLSILDTFIDSGFETALILEDDVDFGLDIRAQMARLAKAIWDHSGENFTSDEAQSHPYREISWDVLWPGHYGMSFVQGSEVFKYDDPSALPWSQLTSDFNNYYEQMASQGKPGQPEPQQLVFNVAPLATFAYATTRVHATRLVQKMSNQGVHRKEGTAFDTAMHIDCTGLSQRCVAPVPQLFHHHKVVGEKSISTEGYGDDAQQDMAWYQMRHKYTFNIEWSARCNAASVGERLEDGWQCLPNKNDPI